MILLNEKNVNVEHFPNGELRIAPDSLMNLVTDMSKVQLITLRFETNEDLLTLMMLSDWLREEGFTRQSLYVPYLPYSRMDRKVGRHLFSLKYVAVFINRMWFEAVYILEAHSSISLELINRSVSLSFVDKLVQLSMINMEFDAEKDCIVFPDKGAKDRYKDIFPAHYRILYGEKTRDFNTGNITNLTVQGDGKPVRKILSVDDLVSRGTTFLQLAKACESLHMQEISLAVTHTENNLYSGNFFDFITRLYTTNAMEPFLAQSRAHPQITVFELPPYEKLIKPE